MNHYISHTHMIEKQTKRKYMLFKSAVKDFFNSVVLANGLENRVGQRILAYDVSKAIVSSKFLIGEAGVGIGKSFAYIIPLLYYNKYFDKPIVISTSTIALQEQIISDIAVASDLINYHPEVINAKGQNHYVCRKRAAQLFSDRHLPGEIIDQIRKGASERIDFSFDIDNRLWNQINTSGYSARICNRCCFSQDCHYRELRSTTMSFFVHIDTTTIVVNSFHTDSPQS